MKDSTVCCGAVKREGSWVLTSDPETPANASSPHPAAPVDAAAQRASEFFNRARDIIFTHDLERFTFVNAAIEAITGYTPEEAIGTPVRDILTPESHALARPMLDRKLVGSADTTTYVVDIVAKDGHRVPIEVISWVMYRDGQPVGVQGIARDITERRRTERALLESEARFRRLADNAHDYIYRYQFRPQPHFTYCSPAVTRMFGYTPEEFYADPSLPLKILVPEDRAQSEMVLEGRQVAEQATLRIRHKDGRIVWAEFRRVPVYDEQGALLAVEAIVRDVSERKRADDGQRLLAEAGELLAGTLDEQAALTTLARLAVPSLADWCTVDIVRPDGSTVGLGGSHVDPQRDGLIRELQRRYPANPSGTVPISAVLRTGRSLLLESVSDAELAASSPDAEHLHLRRRLGFRSAMFVPLRARNRLLGIITLVSGDDRRRYGRSDLELAEELARRAALAVENARLFRAAQDAVQKRDEFLSVAAHELKTPITSLRGFAQLLRRRLEHDQQVHGDELRRAVTIMEQQANKLGHLIAQLLDVTRLDAGKLALDRSPTDLTQLVQRAVEAAQATTDHHQFTLRGTQAITLTVDAMRLEQVLANLFANAIKYSPAGGPIEVSMERAPGQLRITVADRGVGILPAQRGQIFERFYQADGDHSAGMGLGLSISRQIAELHGGRLDYEPRPGAGSCFVLTLPLPAAAPRPSTGG